jgi:L-2-hydroxyglutarate oxidase
MSEPAQLIVVGGGIVGLATAYTFTQRHPGRRVVVIEKESAVAAHQTGRNSGVIHSGIYYKPGSLKAVNCRRGKALLEDFCEAHAVPFERCGKVIVATHERELPRMEAIAARGRDNGVACEVIDRDRLLELEPHAAGIAAIRVPDAGVIDYTVVSERLAELIRDAGGEIVTGRRVTDIDEGSDAVEAITAGGESWRAPLLVGCAGLYSDRLARRTLRRVPVRIVPFRGEYYDLTPAAEHLVRHLIYPVPDPRFPFLGVHFTRRITGRVDCGPSAVPALAREGYRRRDVSLRDMLDTLTWRGIFGMAARYWRMGMGEMWRSLRRPAFVSALRRLVPAVEASHLQPAPSGVRAQAVRPDGRLLDDFLISESPRVVHVLNAPSPAATASLAIGERIVDHLAQHLQTQD